MDFVVDDEDATQEDSQLYNDFLAQIADGVRPHIAANPEVPPEETPAQLPPLADFHPQQNEGDIKDDDSERAGSNQVFRLCAANALALHAIMAQRDKMNSEVRHTQASQAPAMPSSDDRYSCRRQFVRSDKQMPLWMALGSKAPSVETSDTDGGACRDGTVAKEEMLVRPAYFEVTLQTVPQAPKFGWKIGRDTTRFKSDQLADLLLDCSKQEDRVHAQHAAFYFSEVGALCVKALTGRLRVDNHTLAESESCMVASTRQRIKLGNLEFWLSMDRSKDDHTEYLDALRRYIDRQGLGVFVDARIAATPLESSAPNASGWKAMDIANFGTSGNNVDGWTVIESVVNVYTHETAARKTRRRLNSSSAHRTEKEVQAYRKLTDAMEGSPQPEHHFIMKLKDVTYSQGRIDWVHGDCDLVDIYFSPLALGDFNQVLRTRDDFPDKERLRLVVQVLMGLRWLHENGWVHGDIKAGNLAITMPAREAVIIDLEQAKCIREIGPRLVTPGRGGTLGYLAPEQENEKYCKPELEGAFDYTVDIFSLALVALDILPPLKGIPNHIRTRQWAPNPFRRGQLSNDQQRLFAQQREKMLKTSQNSRTYLWALMLEPYAAKRIDARKALAHEAIVEIASREEARLQENSKSKSTPGPATGSKRSAGVS